MKMKSTNDLIMELMERDDQASDFEDLIAEIKTILESPFCGDEYKVQEISKAIKSYDL